MVLVVGAVWRAAGFLTCELFKGRNLRKGEEKGKKGMEMLTFLFRNFLGSD